VAGQAQRDPAGVIYVSLPLDIRLGRDVLRGAELAAGDAAFTLLEGEAEENARRAAADPAALAYLGDFYSRDVAITSRILGEAGLLQVAPVATWTGLGGPTLVRLSPHDGVGARAIAAWVAEHAVGSLLVIHDHDDGYGVPVGRLCAAAARERGLAVTALPIWDTEEEMSVGDAEAVLYVGVAGSGAIGLWHALHARNPHLWLLGSEGVAATWLARALEAPAAARTRFFVAQRAPFAFYGYEAMSLIRASLREDRPATVAAARATRERDSILGRYSLDADGHTTTTDYGVVTVVGGELAWARD
jgi:branched-chain amino acid transport system substrate-binding protein